MDSLNRSSTASISRRLSSEFSLSSPPPPPHHGLIVSFSSDMMRGFFLEDHLLHSINTLSNNHSLNLILESVLVVVFTFGILRLIRTFISPGHPAKDRLFGRIKTKVGLKLKFSHSTPKYTPLETHLPNFPIHNAPDFRLPTLKPATTPHMTMGLRRLDAPNWLTIDSKYLPEHYRRAEFLDNDRSSVLAVHPSAEPACYEVLHYVVSFLTARYPTCFSLSGSGHSQTIHNHLTGESFPVHPSVNHSPLETAARLAMEDFNVLVKDTDSSDSSSEEGRGEYHLLASATLFPAGWKLQDRVGGSMAMLHGPVPGWAKKIGCSVTRYFDHLTPHSAMERFNLFVQRGGELFVCDSFADGRSAVGGSSSVQDQDLAPATALGSVDAKAQEEQPLHPEEIHIRRERQTFVPLPEATQRTGKKHVLFAVRTYLTPLTELSTSEVDALIVTARSWGGEMAAYKGRDGWLGFVEGYREGLGA